MKGAALQSFPAVAALTLVGALLVGCRPAADEGTVSSPMAGEGTPAPPVADIPADAAPDMDETKLTVSTISEKIGARVAGTEKLRETAAYVTSYLSALAYEPDLTDYVLPNGHTAHNVVAATDAPGPRLVLATQMDTVPGCPCADDDATGMAVIIDIARFLKTERLDGQIPVQFAFLGAEEALEGHDECGYSAVKFFEQLPPEAVDRVAAAVWLDGLGRGPRFLASHVAGTSDVAANLFLTASEGEEPQPEIVEAKRWSDDMAFEDHDVPTVWVEWAQDPHLRQPTDPADIVDWEKVEAVAQATLRMVLRRDWMDADQIGIHDSRSPLGGQGAVWASTGHRTGGGWGVGAVSTAMPLTWCCWHCAVGQLAADRPRRNVDG
jgi:hypothetical protein